jgi:ATP synthase protein I
MRSLLILQIVLISAIVAFWGVYLGYAASRASLFGGLIALSNTGLLAWHMQRAQAKADYDAPGSLRIAFVCMAQRLILTLVLFTLGLGALHLLPLPLLSGFIAAQIAAFLNGLKNQV